MYINYVNDQNKNVYVSSWLLLITFLLIVMILVGGLTRLTDSGLSITNWDLFSGILPPINKSDWENYFSLYKKIPEYKLLNSSMTIEEFKVIFWWEYAHRLLGRLIGITFLIPLIYFTWKKIISKKYLIFLYLIFFLILFQGFMGWYMVKSGLTVRTDVSHYRLSTHLTIAFIILILTFWNFLNYNNKSINFKIKKIPYNLPLVFLSLIIIQISIGALVSGLDAAQVYQTWPLMNDFYFPDDSNFKDLFAANVLSIPSLVQFLHRNIAYFIYIFFLFVLYFILREKKFNYFKNISVIIFIFLNFQMLLGIVTIISENKIIYASMHQAGSIFLTLSALILVFKNSKTN